MAATEYGIALGVVKMFDSYIVIKIAELNILKLIAPCSLCELYPDRDVLSIKFKINVFNHTSLSMLFVVLEIKSRALHVL